MTVKVLFTGYAPVHFLCFRPLYDRLRAMPGVEVLLSGGLRTGSEGRFSYDGPGLYRRFAVPEARILPVDDLAKRRFDLAFAANRRVLAPRENVGASIQIFHGVSFRNRGIRPENLAFDHLFLIGPYMSRKFAELGLLDADDPRGLHIGFPKTDALLAAARDLDRIELLARYGFAGDRPVLLYAPTGAAGNSLETVGPEVVERLTAADRYDLLVKPHDHPKNRDGGGWSRALSRLESAHTRLVASEEDVTPLLRASDLLLTDASSVANEYALLDRPIVFIDVPALIQRSGETNEALDLRSWGRKSGIVAGTAPEVVDAVAESLAHPVHLSPVRKALAADLFYNPGRATDAAMGWLTKRFPDMTASARRLAS